MAQQTQPCNHNPASFDAYCTECGAANPCFQECNLINVEGMTLAQSKLYYGCDCGHPFDVYDFASGRSAGEECYCEFCGGHIIVKQA